VNAGEKDESPVGEEAQRKISFHHFGGDVVVGIFMMKVHSTTGVNSFVLQLYFELLRYRPRFDARYSTFLKQRSMSAPRLDQPLYYD